MGASQTDAANLRAENIDWRARTISYQRQKTGQVACLMIGTRLESLLNQLSLRGPLFPNVNQWRDTDRSADFRGRCRLLGIEGVTLHSYRYAWAERAKASGYPERWAQSALGHNSRAAHEAYARDATVVCPSLEEYEKKGVPFRQVVGQ